MILLVSRSIFSLFSTDEETFANSLLWKKNSCCGRVRRIRLGYGGYQPILYAHHIQKDGKVVVIPVK